MNGSQNVHASCLNGGCVNTQQCNSNTQQFTQQFTQQCNNNGSERSPGDNNTHNVNGSVKRQKLQTGGVGGVIAGDAQNAQNVCGSVSEKGGEQWERQPGSSNHSVREGVRNNCSTGEGQNMQQGMQMGGVQMQRVQMQGMHMHTGEGVVGVNGGGLLSVAVNGGNGLGHPVCAPGVLNTAHGVMNTGVLNTPSSVLNTPSVHDAQCTHSTDVASNGEITRKRGRQEEGVEGACCVCVHLILVSY